MVSILRAYADCISRMEWNTARNAVIVKRENVAFGLVIAAWLLWLAYREKLAQFIALANPVTKAVTPADINKAVRGKHADDSLTKSASRGAGVLWDYGIGIAKEKLDEWIDDIRGLDRRRQGGANQ